MMKDRVNGAKVKRVKKNIVINNIYITICFLSSFATNVHIINWHVTNVTHCLFLKMGGSI